MTPSRCRAAATVAIWMVLLAVSLWWLADWEPAPALGATGGLDPVVATMSVVRLAALALGGYLLVVTTVALAVRLLRLPGVVVGAVEALAPSALRPLLRSLAGVTLATVASASPMLVPTAGASPAAVVVSSAEQSAGVAADDEPVLMHRLPDVDDAPPTAVAEPPGLMPQNDATTRIVQPGDHFWSIAESELAGRRGRPVSDAEVDPFWRAMVAANRDVTPDPDLLLPGQVVRLPALP